MGFLKCSGCKEVHSPLLFVLSAQSEWWQIFSTRGGDGWKRSHMYAEVFLPWACNRVGGQSSSVQHQNREHQCNDVVNLVLTLHPGLLNFFDLVFEPGPNLAPEDKSTLSLHTSVNLQIPCCYFPLQCSIHPMFEAKDTSYCHFPRVLAGCLAACYWPSSKTSRVILTLQSTSVPTHTHKL